MYDKLQEYRENIDKNLQIEDLKFNVKNYPILSLNEIELGIDAQLTIKSEGKWKSYITVDEAKETITT